MIESFISSWALFQDSYLAGWLMAIVLAMTGVTVVARNQIFIGAAVSQASTLGIALAMWAGSFIVSQDEHHGESHGVATVMAVLFSVVAAWITAGGRDRGGESREAVTGWVFLFSSSVAILIVSSSPMGLEEVQRLLSSSIIGATRHDVYGFGALAVCTAMALAFARERLTLVLVDPVMAESVGLRIGRWNAGLSIWLGLTIGLSIHSSGMLFTFGCLTLPGLIAKNICREIRPMFWVAPLVALAASVLGFMIANQGDLPPAQMTVALLCGLHVVAWGTRSLHLTRA